ncbi:MAG: beta-ketoacyl-ACP synthase III [Gemmatimonadales bacterium]|nr:beta-ketoacyl-ACP synthase III [Gemmatimonadales bacterium]
MRRTEFLSTGFHVPARVVTNDDLAKIMDTSEEWIVQRSGIKTRRWVSEGDTGVSLAREASLKALAKAGLTPRDLDCIIYCTCTPDHFEPGNGVFLQRELGITDIPALDVRNQCSGFIYGLSIADAWIRTGQYRRILLVGAEVHSRGLDKTTRGRDTAVLFGDGAGAVVLGPLDGNGAGRGVLSTHIFADGRYAEKLWVDGPGLAHDPYVSVEMLEQGLHRAVMEGREVFKFASIKMPESVGIALAANQLKPGDIKLLVPHQANLRIIEMVQKAAGLRDDQVYINIQRYGNTTAASIPIALDEALAEHRLARGDLLVLTAFGSGFTWGSAAIRW